MIGFLIVLAFNLFWLFKFKNQFIEVLLFRKNQAVSFLILGYNLIGLAYLLSFLIINK